MLFRHFSAVLAVIFLSTLSPSFADDGDLDPTFIAEKLYSPSGTVYATAVQDDGKILAAGVFD